MRNCCAITLSLILAGLLGAYAASAQTKPATAPTTRESVGAADADGLSVAYKTAIDANDVDGRLALHYWEGADPKDARRLRKVFETDAASNPKVISSAVTKLEGDERKVYAESVLKDGNGRRPNLEPIARLDISVDLTQPGGLTVKSMLVFPVGEKDGRFYIVGYLAKPKG